MKIDITENTLIGFIVGLCVAGVVSTYRPNVIQKIAKSLAGKSLGEIIDELGRLEPVSNKSTDNNTSKRSKS